MRAADLVLYLALAAGLTSIVFALLADRVWLFRRRRPGRDESRHFPFDAKVVGEAFFKKSFPPADTSGRGDIKPDDAFREAGEALASYEEAKPKGGAKLENAQRKLADSVGSLFKSFTREEYRSDEELRKRVNDLLDDVWKESREKGGG
ncbi:MAG: hypothetical protein LC795_16295 [Acidobacteria bacterium]|nr:hypothetical protein [Acidobacteriota bacterium]